MNKNEFHISFYYLEKKKKEVKEILRYAMHQKERGKKRFS
jgi:hypothetical protein